MADTHFISFVLVKNFRQPSTKKNGNTPNREVDRQSRSNERKKAGLRKKNKNDTQTTKQTSCKTSHQMNLEIKRLTWLISVNGECDYSRQARDWKRAEADPRVRQTAQ